MEIKKNTVLIIGSSSYSAQSFISKYNQDKEHRIVGLTSKAKDSKQNLLHDVFTYDEIELLSDIQFDLVVVFASRLPSEGVSDAVYFEFNGVLKKIISGFVSMSTNSRIVYLSTFAVYDSKASKLDEMTQLNPRDAYARAKVEMESFILRWAEERNIQAIVARLPVFLYPKGSSNFINRLANQIRLKGEFQLTNADQKFGAVFSMESLVELTKSTNETSAIVNCSSYPDITFKELADLAFGFGLKHIGWKVSNSPSPEIEIETLSNFIEVASARSQIIDYLKEELEINHSMI